MILAFHDNSLGPKITKCEDPLYKPQVIMACIWYSLVLRSEFCSYLLKKPHTIPYAPSTFQYFKSEKGKRQIYISRMSPQFWSHSDQNSSCFWLMYMINNLKRSIFQTFWKPDCCPDFLFLELETSNFGYLLIFWFSLTVQSFSKIGQHWYKTFYKGPPLMISNL